MDFTKYLDFSRSLIGGKQKVYRFPNGYGASVVQHMFSYGGVAGKWEVAMIKYKGPGKLDWNLEYDDDRFTDVIGYLDDNEVDKYLQYIFDKEASNA